MPKCPHCGETMTKGQEVCFACGQHVRERTYHRVLPHNRLVLLLVGALVVGAFVGMIIISGARSRRAAREARREEQARIEQAARAETQAKRDSTRAAARNDAVAVLVAEVNDLESRFALVRKQVVREQPSPAQARLISQLNTELAGLHQLTAAIASQPDADNDSLRSEARDGQRRVRTLISDLSRAPKK
jgi:predicted  nucleic acid-binding Zn-ribbon protein